MDPLKEMFNRRYYEQLASALKRNYPVFDDRKFLAAVMENIDALSLNQRLRNTSLVLKKFMPDDYAKTISIFNTLVPVMQGGYTNLVFPDYVSQFGFDDWKVSLNALKYFTCFGSSEFAVREFLKRDFDRTLSEMEKWSRDKNPHVRRLASEGSRPRLPWSFKLDRVISDPASTSKILNNLKADVEPYVRKSVANHLNDISKDNPEYMLGVLNSWDKSNVNTLWIIRHSSRTLIKKGSQATLSLFDYERSPKVTIVGFKNHTPKLKLGQSLSFDFQLSSQAKKPQKLVIDYLIHYVKKSGVQSAKVFKLKDLTLNPGETRAISRRQLIRDFTTRKHFAGEHAIEIQVNGKVLYKEKFYLTV